jgi:crotonobetainyl-CoA:carnitine CoA-transferase CaiB-like acyl-CoA transferase
MGAEVIKVEEPGRGDYIRSLPPHQNGVSIAFEMLNRGKKSITLNLEKEAGREILRKLIASADVFIESFLPRTTRKLGCDFESVSKVNPRIVYCSLTAFGQTGPYKDMPGHDINVIALSGFLNLNGSSEPVIPHFQVGDLAGGMLAAFAITTALFARQQTNQAQNVDVSMLDALLSWLDVPLALQMAGDYARILEGNIPFYRLYRARDFKLLALGAIESQFWEGLCKLIKRPDLLADQYSPDPRRTEVVKAIQSAFATKTRDEWFRIMLKHNLPCTPVLTLKEVVKNPHARSRQMILQKDHSRRTKTPYVGNPCKISGLGSVDLSPSPRLGEHSVELLKEIGFSDSRIQSFIAARVI